jgi:hypothetical protein
MTSPAAFLDNHASADAGLLQSGRGRNVSLCWRMLCYPGAEDWITSQQIPSRFRIMQNGIVPFHGEARRIALNNC